MTKTKLSEEAKAFFHGVVPPDPRVATRPMFGALASFLKGNMFAGVHAERIFVRLPEELQAKALAEGAERFAPMPGRASKNYVSLPSAWNDDPARIEGWIDEALAFAETLPEKLPAKKKAARE
jgi:TfoX/Sxy family transcriptional regulator of competence genes